MKAVLKCFRTVFTAHRCYCAKPGQEMKFLNVAEKNDAAKTIAGLLSNGAARRVRNLVGILGYIYPYIC